jgi:hypothetical protein
MWKANGKTTTLLLFLDGLFQKQRQMRDASSGDKTFWRQNTPPFGSPVGSVSRGNRNLKSQAIVHVEAIF